MTCFICKSGELYKFEYDINRFDTDTIEICTRIKWIFKFSFIYTQFWSVEQKCVAPAAPVCEDYVSWESAGKHLNTIISFGSEFKHYAACYSERNFV